MKYLTFAILFAFALPASAQHNLTKIWETDTILAVPESVLYTKDLLYVALVDGDALEVDGKGGIAKIGLDGKVINANWVTGLHAPKGMALWKQKLYVANINEVVVIDTTTGKIDSRIPVPGSIGLNDLCIDERGRIYTSDSELGNIHRITNGKPELYLSGLPGANGLRSIGTDLFIITASDIYSASPDKKLSSLSKFYKGGDGLVPIGAGNFIATVYNGHIYYLSKSGQLSEISDTESQKIGSADVDYNPAKHVLYVPTLFRNSIIAYQLN